MSFGIRTSDDTREQQVDDKRTSAIISEADIWLADGWQSRADVWLADVWQSRADGWLADGWQSLDALSNDDVLTVDALSTWHFFTVDALSTRYWPLTAGLLPEATSAFKAHLSVEDGAGRFENDFREMRDWKVLTVCSASEELLVAVEGRPVLRNRGDR